MHHFPTTAAQVEVTYRPERDTAQFHPSGGRSHRSERGVTRRVRRQWHHDQAA
jgi:hypothetical protein